MDNPERKCSTFAMKCTCAQSPQIHTYGYTYKGSVKWKVGICACCGKRKLICRT